MLLMARDQKFLCTFPATNSFFTRFFFAILRFAFRLVNAEGGAWRTLVKATATELKLNVTPTALKMDREADGRR